MLPFRPGFSSARPPLLIGSGVQAVADPRTGTQIITQRPVNTTQNEDWKVRSGPTGPTGADGSNADCSGYTPIGDKSASLRTASAGNVKVMAIEGPRFYIFETFQVREARPITQPLLDCCEPGSMRVLSCHIAGPAHAYAYIENDTVKVVTQPWNPSVKVPLPSATVLLCGIRRGCAMVIFPPATDYEVDMSEKYVARCRGELPPHPASLGLNACDPSTGCC